MTREEAYGILTKYMKGEHYITHSLAVEAIMKGLAKRLAPDDVEYWGIVGLLHDIDFEQYPEEHCLRAPELPKLLTMTLEAMATCEDEIQAEMRSEE